MLAQTRLPTFLAATSCAALVFLPPTSADACSFAGNTDFAVDDSLADNASPIATAVRYQVFRTDDDDGCGATSSCAGAMTMSIDIDVTDDQTENFEMGFLVRLVDGDVPITIPTTAVGASGGANGQSSLFFFWQSDDPTSGTLEITPIDRAGNMGTPILVDVEDSGDSGVSGCGVGSGGGWLAGLFFLGLFASRRRRP